MHDIIFFTHASKNTGFGHAARCANIAKKLREEHPTLKIGFAGEFSSSAKELISKICKPSFTKTLHCKVGIYDRMDDEHNPEFWCEDKLNALRSSSQKTIFIANGITKPAIPQGIIGIGYKLGPQQSNDLPFLWSLKYAPVGFGGMNLSPPTKGRLFVALGGGADFSATEKVISASLEINSVRELVLLISPVNSHVLPEKKNLISDRIKIVSHVNDLTTLMSSAEAVVASYGHLGYEALGIGRPVCLIGQKKFQAEYSDRLDTAGLCVSAGLISDISVNSLSHSISRTINNENNFSQAAAAEIDGWGLDRISKVIFSAYETA